MRFAFANLSGLDFEELVHDLLQARWGIELEIFKPGKDGGIDLRGWQGADSLIIQCKNFAGSTFSSLKAKLRSEELPKIRRLAPERYVLVTSLPLSAPQTDELAGLLSPYVKTPDDIIGGTRLELMLEEEEDIVKRHHKLWLTSVPVLERVLHAAEHEQTRAHVERVGRNLPLFVQTRAYARALEALERHRIVIVSGLPGIGKSTLADMLLYAHVSDGFQPAVIRGGLAEGRRLATGGKPTIFHFDDFLGETHLGDRPEFLGRKEDADLVDFVDWVLASNRHRFVLTTREHVLADALQRSEKFRHHGLAEERCVITVGDFGRAQRARILYNHLYFSTLPDAYREEMLADDFFLEIVDSRTFNPRIVQWLASEGRLRGVPPEGYREHVRTLLKNPQEIWRHAYQQELSQAARDILMARHSLSYGAFTDDVERLFRDLHARSIARSNLRSGPAAWRSGLKELEGSFINIGRQETDFINPSVRDFLSTILDEDPVIALDIVAVARRFVQLERLWEGSGAAGPFENVRRQLVENQEDFAAACDRLLNAPNLRWFDEPGGRMGRYIDSDHATRAKTLLDMRSDMPALHDVSLRGISIVAEKVTRGPLRIGDVTSLLAHGWGHRDRGDLEDVRIVFDAVNGDLPNANASDWMRLFELRATMEGALNPLLPAFEDLFEDYKFGGVTMEREDNGVRSELETMLHSLERLSEMQDYDFERERQAVSDAIDECILEEEEETNSAPTPRPGRLAPEVEDEMDDGAIRAMFASLRGRP
jgi:hypothetical protein